MSPSTTHVANASDVPIWAKVTDDGTKVIRSVVLTIPGKVEARIETASKFAAEHGICVLSGDFTDSPVKESHTY
nr:unnamed protein product [Haemonchus contortus]